MNCPSDSCVYESKCKCTREYVIKSFIIHPINIMTVGDVFIFYLNNAHTAKAKNKLSSLNLREMMMTTSLKWDKGE